eukprot:1600467-Rhodomonas_salina.1
MLETPVADCSARRAASLGCMRMCAAVKGARGEAESREASGCSPLSRASDARVFLFGRYLEEKHTAQS